MSTPEEKGQAIVVSDKEFAIIEVELGGMRDAVAKMPHPQCGSFRQPLADCQEEFDKLRARFASLKQEISDQEASTSPLADPNPPSSNSKWCRPAALSPSTTPLEGPKPRVDERDSKFRVIADSEWNHLELVI
jgi:hypothetical protein